jgi:hypothetical protein
MDRHGAWQREFALLLKLLSQWLKVRGLRTSGVVQVISQLKQLAQREPARLAILSSNEDIRLRMVHALCLPPNHGMRTLASRYLKWSGLRTWTFEPDQPTSIKVTSQSSAQSGLRGQTSATAESHDVVLSLDSVNVFSIRQTLDEARAYSTVEESHAPTDIPAQADAHAPVSSANLNTSSLVTPACQWWINLHHPEFQNELCVHECPIHHLEEKEAKLLIDAMQACSYHFWLVDTASFNPQLETQLFFTVLSDAIKKGKTLWLLAFGVTGQRSDHAQGNTSVSVDPAIKEWAIGLGLAPEQLIGLVNSPSEPLDIREVAEKIQDTIISKRRTQWLTSMHDRVAHLRLQAQVSIDTLAVELEVEMEKKLAARRASYALVKKARDQAGAASQQCFDHLSQLAVIRTAQLNLRAKVWAALDGANKALHMIKGAEARDQEVGPDLLRLILLEWFDLGKRSLESASALLKVGAVIFVKEFQKHSIEKSMDRFLANLPNVQSQMERLDQHKKRNLDAQLRWTSLTTSEAYACARVAQIALDSVLEATRTQTAKWFESTLEAINTQCQIQIKKQERHHKLLETLSAAQYQASDEPNLGRHYQRDDQKEMLDQQIELLNAALKDALPLPAGGSADVMEWIDSRLLAKSDPHARPVFHLAVG